MDIIQFLSDKPTVWLTVVAIFSLLVGSFLNVVIYRLPRMMQNNWNQECREYLGLKPHPTETARLNLYLPLSHCARCKSSIKPWHNIPLLSFFLLRGKCAYCQAAISMRYPLVEALTLLASVFVAYHFGWSVHTIAGLFCTWILICLAFIDLEHQLLPDQLTLLLLWIGLFLSIFTVFTDSTHAILGAIIGYAIFAAIQWSFQLLTGRLGMGQGDLKLLAALGALLGLQQLPIIILLASVSGLLISFIHMLVKRNFKSVPIPFGPYLAFAGWISLLWGNELYHFYLHKFLL